jgi:ribosomal protein S18 acetylase RimI-like enzyme
MAAQAEQPEHLEVLDLRHLRAKDLSALLAEQVRTWAARLRWGFQPSCDIVRHYLDLRALNGYALMRSAQPIGYCYYVHENHKILIGDLFVSEAYRTAERQEMLLAHVIETAQNTPGVRRIEAQLIMLEGTDLRALYPAAELSVFERNFMLVEGIGNLRRELFGHAAPAAEVVFQPWGEQQMEAAAWLIARAYEGHVDSRINDQYRSAAGARRFLHNITQYPGCGAFYGPAARVALERRSGTLCGVSLTSLVEPQTGHITQVCVAPEMRGMGVGSELLWRSIRAFVEAGCTAASLTVTASNNAAVRLYEQIGFRTIRRFQAYVWEGFR